ncbi:MAG TPA: hypothetical protein VJP86_14210 [Vicinamibacterales bacterium]|nr:hypothetical protein [Vicinamibacterales bacterium]
MGTALIARKSATVAALVVVLLACASAAPAAERYAFLVTSASGRSEYALKYQSWRTSFLTLLRVRFRYPDERIVSLAEEESQPTRKPTRENVKAAFADLARRASKDDEVFIFLIGHGTVGSSDDARFNLVGPDLTADEWAALVDQLPSRVVFVNMASGSFPFLQKIAKPGRIVITATANPMQEYETVFPEYFLQAFGEGQADIDKDGRVSIWEAFRYASAGVRRWFDERGQLPTERPLLDDNGDGVGREADDRQADGRQAVADGPVAQVTYLRPEVAAVPAADTALAALRSRRTEVQQQVDALRARKPLMSDADYQAQLEALLLELARIDRDIRARTP